MDKRKETASGHHENPLPHEISPAEKWDAAKAHQSAEKDMDEDVEFSAHSPNDDLDEGETARLGEDKNDLV